MQIDAVRPEFTHLTIRRSGGFAGIDQTLNIDRNLNVTVECARTGARAFTLDAAASQELMQALAAFATVRPEASSVRGMDGLNYDIELSWNGQTYRVHSADIGADDALHGVMFVANRLLSAHTPGANGAMSLHDVPREGVVAGNGNGGIVPPWMRSTPNTELVAPTGNGNGGIVPPWMRSTPDAELVATAPNGNSGVVGSRLD